MWIYGAGGFGREALDACRAAGFEVTGFIDDGIVASEIHGVPVRSLTEAAAGPFVVAIADPATRLGIHRRLVGEGWTPVSVVDPRAVIGSRSSIGEGSIVLATAYVSVDVTLGAATHLNYGVTIGHDTVGADGTTVLPGANVGGAVTIGEGVVVGSGAVVLQGLPLGGGAVVGAGAVVTKPVAPGVTVVGAPARPLQS